MEVRFLISFLRCKDFWKPSTDKAFSNDHHCDITSTLTRSIKKKKKQFVVSGLEHVSG